MSLFFAIFIILVFAKGAPRSWGLDWLMGCLIVNPLVNSLVNPLDCQPIFPKGGNALSSETRTRLAQTCPVLPRLVQTFELGKLLLIAELFHSSTIPTDQKPFRNVPHNFSDTKI